MKKNKIKMLWVIGLIVLLLLIKSCDYFFDFEKKISHISENVNQSKENKVFVNKIKLGSFKFNSNPEPLKILKFDGWVEKTVTYQGNDLMKIDEKSLSIIFDIELDKKFELNKKNYGETWAIYYSKSNSISSLISSSSGDIRGSFEVDKDSIKKIIELRICKFKIKNRSAGARIVGIFKILQIK